MAWGLGKKKEEGADDAAKAAEKAEREEMLNAFAAKFEEIVKPVRDSVADMQAKWAKVESAATTPPDENHDVNGNELTDEQKRAARDRALVGGIVATNARLTEAEVIGEVAAKWSGFLPKIKEYFAACPLERKGQADYVGYCRNIVKMVIGDAALAGGLSYDGNQKRFFLEDSAATTGENADVFTSDLNWSDKNGKTVSATDQLARLGIDPKEFADSVKEGRLN